MIKLETGMHVKAVLFIIAKSGNKPNIHQLDKNKMQYSHTFEILFSCKKKCSASIRHEMHV